MFTVKLPNPPFDLVVKDRPEEQLGYEDVSIGRCCVQRRPALSGGELWVGAALQEVLGEPVVALAADCNAVRSTSAKKSTALLPQPFPNDGFGKCSVDNL